MYGGVVVGILDCVYVGVELVFGVVEGFVVIIM